MRIELSLPALERLIGGDTEVEISLRKQIVQEFAKRHLKEVAEQATYHVAVEETKKLVNEAAKEVFDIENLTKWNSWPDVGHRLKSMIEALVKEHAQKAVEEQIANIIKWQRHDWAKYVNRMIEESISKEIDKQVEAEILRRLSIARDNK